MSTMVIRLGVITVLLAGLAACSGGGGASQGNQPAAARNPPPGSGPTGVCQDTFPGTLPVQGGIEGSGSNRSVARGPIRKLNQLVVAGQQWDVSHASITIDGQPATAGLLALGQGATVQGTTAGPAVGVADVVVSETRVAGPISYLDAMGDPNDASVQGHLVVLGQPVRLVRSNASGITRISPAGLAVGDTVGVSALASANGTLVATRIDRRAADLEYLVTGIVKLSDASAQSFAIGGLAIDYSGVLPTGFPGGVIHDGDLARVFGRVPAGSAMLQARAIEFRLATPPGPADERIFLSGLVTRYVSSADFDVDGVPIATSAATAFDPIDLVALNASVSVVGTLLADGRVDATRVTISVYNTAVPDVGGTIQALDVQAGVLKVLGVTVTTDATTQVLDARVGASGSIALSALRVGDYVWSYGGIFDKARLIERRDASSSFLISGDPGASVQLNTFTLHGVPIVENPNAQYFGSCGPPARNVVGASYSPQWGPCGAAEFWTSYRSFAGPLIPSVTVSGTVRQCDGAAVANVVVVTWD